MWVGSGVQVASFGDRLRKEREDRGITLDDIALTTKIGTRLLRALEEEKFDQLPGGIFNKGFVRAYARHVGIDEDQAIADYISAVGGVELKGMPDLPNGANAPERGPGPVAVQQIHAAREDRTNEPAAAIPWGLLAIALLLIALAFASWSYYHREQRLNLNRVPSQPQVEGADVPGAIGGTTADRDPTTVSIAAHPITPVPPSGTQFPSAARAVQQAAALATLTAGTPGTFAVLLKEDEESDECWVSITVDGNLAYEAILVAPTQKLIVAKNEVVVKAGNVGALDFFFNGKKLTAQGDYGKVKTLRFHSDGLQAPAPQPSAPQ
jgi:cytoskeleton protein RodZ